MGCVISSRAKEVTNPDHYYPNERTKVDVRETIDLHSSNSDLNQDTLNNDNEDPSEQMDDRTEELFEKKDDNTDEYSEEDEPATFDEFHNQSVAVLGYCIAQTKSLPNILDENGEIDTDVVNVLLYVYELSFIPNNLATQPSDSKSHRVDIAKRCVDNKLIHTLYAFLSHVYNKCCSDIDIDVDTFDYFSACLVSIHNYTDVSEEFCIAVCKEQNGEFMKLMKMILSQNGISFLNTLEMMEVQTIVSCVLCIMHNITMRESCVTRVRQQNFTDVVKSYLQSEINSNKINSLSILAAIIEDKHIMVIAINKDIVQLLVDMLRDGLDNKMRCASLDNISWSCTESALIIRRLAGNNENKKILIEAGCLEVLVKLGESAVDDDEILESVRAIWALAFDPEIRKSMLSNKKLGVVDLLSKLMQSDNQKINKTCVGALWTIHQKESFNVNKAADFKEKTNAEDGHVMISYQWADQDTIIEIKDSLELAGFKVWIDIEEMKGSIASAMASAVENANIFLMCMSQKYQNSLNCRSEADYAFQLRKTIMPLKMEEGYQPRSWTGIICGSKKYYEFSENYKTNTKLEELIRDISKTLTELDKEPKQEVQEGHHPLSIVSKGVPNSEPVAMSTRITYSSHVSDVTLDTIRGWTQTDIDNWIEKKNLKSCGINNRTGKEIALLVIMITESPEAFYRCLESMWGIKDTLTLADIVWALKDLTKELEQKKTE